MGEEGREGCGEDITDACTAVRLFDLLPVLCIQVQTSHRRDTEK